NDHDAAGAIAMRVRILFSWTAMRCPARVADAICAVHRILLQDVFKVAQFAFGPAHVQLVIFIDHGNTGGAVAAIFELSQTFDNQRYDLFVSDVSDYSAHSDSVTGDM